MDLQQQRQVNEAAEQFAEAVRDSYQAVADRTVSAQQLNAELTQSFFNSVINNLRAQAESNREMTQELISQQKRQREATQAFTRESMDDYVSFVNSLFSNYQEALKQDRTPRKETPRSRAPLADSDPGESEFLRAADRIIEEHAEALRELSKH